MQPMVLFVVAVDLSARSKGRALFVVVVVGLMSLMVLAVGQPAVWVVPAVGLAAVLVALAVGPVFVIPKAVVGPKFVFFWVLVAGLLAVVTVGPELEF